VGSKHCGPPDQDGEPTGASDQVGVQCDRAAEQLGHWAIPRHRWSFDQQLSTHAQHTAEKRDELASLQLIELHPTPKEPGLPQNIFTKVSQEVSEWFDTGQ
jgi:hypothetical protein